MFILMILGLCAFTSSRALCAERSVCAPVGASVHMATQLPNSTDFTTFYWRFRSELNSSVNIVTYMQTYVDTVVSEVYGDRVEISKETFSLTLKKLRKTDSGIYTAEASGLKVTDITRYNLTVLDAVSPPASGSVCLLKTVLCTVTLILMLSAVITVHIRERLLNKDLRKMTNLKCSSTTSGNTQQHAVSPLDGASVCLLKTLLYSVMLILML
ncbi:uncharacterized protein LOC118241691 [Electrophorus electricus]|uniref:uncharacterized protein LOC118241691 n=1 Tax=Electrophorus electricus TaxID=8005 RepID=UPI0015D082C0|nr:uncharacterized protein LOC118241691 [Electrophorus electricus]